MSEQIESLIARMTLEEKISLLAGADAWHTVAIPRLGIPAIKTTDGPLGARGVDFPSSPTSACFPCGTALAATWNPELVRQVGRALGEETWSKGARILLAPTVNIHRSPLAGRNFECYSEDPYLTSRMAVAYIQGLQSQGVAACIKHFVCNDSEFERHTMNSQVGERALREIYLRPFEMALREAHPWAVMSSYNRINGAYASENNHLLLDILKGEWAFDGMVISDWFGTYSRNVVRGGLDLEMPGPARWMGKPALEAVRRGEVGEAVIDDKVRRILKTLGRVNAFECPELPAEQAIDKPEHRALARQAAAEAIVLLKNENSILPLDRERVKSIAVIGENARWASILGGGSVRVHPHYVVAPLEAIKSKVGDRAKYSIGCPIHRTPPLFDQSWWTDEPILHYFGNRALAGEPVHTETTRKAALDWFGGSLPNVDPTNFSLRLTGTFRVPESGNYQLYLQGVGPSRLFVDGKKIVDLWRDDEEWHRGAEADLPLVAGQQYSLTIEYGCDPDSPWRSLRFGAMPPLPPDPMQEAVALAAQAEVAIVFAGLTNEWESEGFDRPDMELPGAQAELIERVAAANPNTIVVVNAGSPIAMGWLGKTAGVLQAWYLGQETGNAIVDILFGDANPSGKLPTTWPKRLQDNPAYLNYPGENGHVLYGEGLFVGYRFYDKKDVEPLFPFGYGLSYTTFAYRDLRIGAPEYTAGDTIRVSVEIENTGRRAGQEIVQLYLRDVASHLVRPEKELKAFVKVALEPGEARRVEFALGEESLSYYDPAVKGWIAEPGEFEVLVGSSSRDIRLTGRFNFREKAA